MSEDFIEVCVNSSFLLMYIWLKRAEKEKWFALVSLFLMTYQHSWVI